MGERIETPYAYMLRTYRAKHPEMSLRRARHSLPYALAVSYARTHGLPDDRASIAEIVENDEDFRKSLNRLRRRHGRSK